MTDPSQPKVKYCVAVIIGLMIPIWGNGQSITSSLDPTEPVRLPAAAGWRENKVIGFTYREASGNREVDAIETHKFDITSTTANFHFKINNVAVEGSWLQSSREITVEQKQDGWINLDYKVGRLNLALLGNGFVSVGLGGQEVDSHDFFDATHDSEDTTESAINGSISVKVLNFLHLGGGFERVKQQRSHEVDNNWNTVLMGAAMHFGEPEGTQLRLEYSFAASPESKSDAQGNKKEAIHHETNTSSYAVELMLKGLLFIVRGTENKLFLDKPVIYDNEEFDVLKISSSEAGVLWVPEHGFVLGFFLATSKTSFRFEDETSEFRVNLGYVFE